MSEEFPDEDRPEPLDLYDVEYDYKGPSRWSRLKTWWRAARLSWKAGYYDVLAYTQQIDNRVYKDDPMLMEVLFKIARIKLNNTRSWGWLRGDIERHWRNVGRWLIRKPLMSRPDVVYLTYTSAESLEAFVQNQTVLVIEKSLTVGNRWGVGEYVDG